MNSKTFLIFLFFISLCVSNLTFSQGVKIDGLSGEILIPPKNHYYDYVTITIVNANLLKYSYEMKVDKEIFLVKNYNIIGNNTTPAPSVTENNLSVLSDIISSSEKLLLDTGGNEKFIKFKTILNDIIFKMDTLNFNILQLEKNFDALYNESNVSAIINDTIKCKDTIKIKKSSIIKNKWNPTYFDACKNINDSLINELDRINSIRNLISRFNLEFLAAQLSEEIKIVKASTIQEIENKLDLFSNYILRINALLDRWLFIKKINKEPVISQKLVLGDSPKKYIVSVTWKKINDPKISSPIRYLYPEVTSEAKKESGEEEILKKITLEIYGHTKSYFNFNLGLAQYNLPYDNSYSFQSIYSDSNIMYEISKNNLRAPTKFYMALGIYFLGFSESLDFFPGVDELDTKSKNLNIMLMIGSNISAPPKNFMIGLGLDHKAGFNLNVGIATYTATFLNDSWNEDQVITQAIKSVVVSPPTHTSTKVGGFVSIGFRPQIFGFFKKLFGVSL